jgi:hypothetical protein
MDIAGETIEAVVSTNTMSEEEHLQAKVFVAFVRCLELHRMARQVRRYVGRLCNLPVHLFYTRLAEHQHAHHGLLAPTLRNIQRDVAVALTADELVWPWDTDARDGTRLKYHKALALDIASEPERFIAELRAFVETLLPEGPLPGFGELLRYQAEFWVRPDFDPRDPASFRFEYQHDWVGFLECDEGAEGQVAPLIRPNRVVYRAPPLWAQHNYQGAPGEWRQHVLVEHMPGLDHCCHGLRGREVTYL